MIKANELRLGNIVLYQSYPQEVRLSEIEIQQHIERKLLHESHGVDPFPLTSDILLSSGFEFQSKDHYLGSPPVFSYIRDDVSIIHLIPDDNNVSFKMCDNSSWDTPYQPIEYVHQLQNLYFALYGEELNIVL